jgi:hypothetical protein
MEKWLTYLLLTIPISFKLEIIEGVRIMPQEPFLFIFCILITAKNYRCKIQSTSLPYLALILSLLIVGISTLISLVISFDIIGLIKNFKYALYAYSIFLLANSSGFNQNFVRFFLTIGRMVIVFSLGLYFYWFLTLGMPWENFVSFTTWHAEYMPTGLSNLVFSFSDMVFMKVGGNHGIYGTYLVILAIVLLVELKNSNFRRGKILAVLILVNISFLTSRETLLLIFLTLFFSVCYHLLHLRINKKFLYIFVSLFIGVTVVLVVWQPDFVLLNKLEHMFSSLGKGSVDNNVSYRFNTWKLYFGYIINHPWWLVLGLGFNRTRFENVLMEQENAIHEVLPHVSVPESFYVGSLAYGGLAAFFLGVLFFLLLLFQLSRNRRKVPLLPFLVIGLMVTNGTGSSILAELVISQLGLVYLYATK